MGQPARSPSVSVQNQDPVARLDKRIRHASLVNRFQLELRHTQYFISTPTSQLHLLAPGRNATRRKYCLSKSQTAMKLKLSRRFHFSTHIKELFYWRIDRHNITRKNQHTGLVWVREFESVRLGAALRDNCYLSSLGQRLSIGQNDIEWNCFSPQYLCARFFY